MLFEFQRARRRSPPIICLTTITLLPILGLYLYHGIQLNKQPKQPEPRANFHSDQVFLDTLEQKNRKTRKQKTRKLPAGLLIGTKKCGTGALKHMLRVHPNLSGESINLVTQPLDNWKDLNTSELWKRFENELIVD